MQKLINISFTNSFNNKSRGGEATPTFIIILNDNIWNFQTE